MDLKNLAHYTLLWIVCVDDYCEIYKMPKVKNSRFLKRMDWKGEERYWNVKFMYSWYLTSEQTPEELIIEPRRFLIEICLRGRPWWECPNNSCLWHVQEKINKRYWLKGKTSDDEELRKEEAYRTRGRQW